MAPFSPIPPRHPIRVVLSSTALSAVHVGAEGRRAGDRAAWGCGILRLRCHAIGTWGISCVVRPRSDGACGVRACHRHRKLGSAHSWRLRGPCHERIRPTRRRIRDSGGIGRACAPRCARLRRRWTLPGRRVGHGHRRMALHRVREARGSGDAARGRRDRSCCGYGLVSGATSVATRWREASGSASEFSRSPWFGASSRSPAAAHRRSRLSRRSLHQRPSPVGRSIDAALTYLLGFALTLTVIGGGEALARAAHEFPPPRVHALRRTGFLTFLFALLVTTLGTFLRHPARARCRTGALGECAVGRTRAALGRASRGYEI